MKILNRLKEANLKIQLDKCEFFRKEVQYLGHTVSEEGVKPNTDKIEIIKKMAHPKKQKGNPPISRNLRVLSQVHQRFCEIGETFNRATPQRSRFQHHSRNSGMLRKM